MSILWDVLTKICFYIPWLLMAAAAGMVLSKHRKSRPAFLEALGATACIIIAGVAWIILSFLGWMKVGDPIIGKVSAVFSFLEVVAMLTFALGFCWEKFQQWRLPADNDKPADPAANTVTVTAVPSP